MSGFSYYFLAVGPKLLEYNFFPDEISAKSLRTSDTASVRKKFKRVDYLVKNKWVGRLNASKT